MDEIKLFAELNEAFDKIDKNFDIIANDAAKVYEILKRYLELFKGITDRLDAIEQGMNDVEYFICEQKEMTKGRGY